MNIENHISNLNYVIDNITELVFKELESVERYVLAIPKQRLYQKGTDAFDVKIKPLYRPSYVKKKRRKGKRASHVTLNYTGNLWDSFMIIKEGNGIDFTAPETKITQFLKEKYSGNTLFGFSKEDEKVIDERFIIPFIEDLIEPKEDIEFNF